MFYHRNAENEEIPFGNLAEACYASTLYRQHEKKTLEEKFKCTRIVVGILAMSSVMAIWQGKLVLCCKAVFVSSQRLEEISPQGNSIKNETTRMGDLDLKKNEAETTCSAQQVSGKENLVAKATAFRSREKMAHSSYLLDCSYSSRLLMPDCKSECPQMFA